MGFRVAAVSNADEALAVLQTEKELCGLFTDLEMPGSMNGLALAKVVRPQPPDAVIVISSGRWLPQYRELPADTRFLAKPYFLSDLEVIADEIRQRERPRK